MKQAVRIAAWLVASLMLVAMTCELVLYMANLRTRHQAEALLTAIGHLRLGESTLTDTQPLRIEYNAIKNPDGTVGSAVEQSYSIILSNYMVNAISFKYPRLWRLAVKPSWVGVNLRYRQEKLSYLSYSFGTPMLEASSRPTELTAQVRLQEHDAFNERQNYHIGVGWGPTPGEFGITVIIAPTATREERNAAFDFDLSCMSSLRGCQALCEIMPSVWREALRRYEKKEISMPQELLENPRCSPH